VSSPISCWPLCLIDERVDAFAHTRCQPQGAPHALANAVRLLSNRTVAAATGASPSSRLFVCPRTTLRPRPNRLTRPERVRCRHHSLCGDAHHTCTIMPSPQAKIEPHGRAIARHDFGPLGPDHALTSRSMGRALRFPHLPPCCACPASACKRPAKRAGSTFCKAAGSMPGCC